MSAPRRRVSQLRPAGYPLVVAQPVRDHYDVAGSVGPSASSGADRGLAPSLPARQPAGVLTKTMVLELLPAIVCIIQPGEDLVVERTGPSSLGIALPAAELEFIVRYKMFVKGPAWENAKLDYLQSSFVSLSDPATFVRKKRGLLFSMAGLRVKLIVGPMNGGTKGKAAWEHCLGDPLFHSLSLLLLDAVSADPSIVAEGVTPYVVFGLVAIFLTQPSMVPNVSTHGKLCDLLSWLRLHDFSKHTFIISSPLITLSRDPSQTSPLSILLQSHDGQNLTRRVTQAGMVKLQTLSRNWRSALSSEKPMSRHKNRMIPFAAERTLQRTSPLLAANLPKYKIDKLAQATQLALRRAPPSAPGGAAPSTVDPLRFSARRSPTSASPAVKPSGLTGPSSSQAAVQPSTSSRPAPAFRPSPGSQTAVSDQDRPSISSVISISHPSSSIPRPAPIALLQSGSPKHLPGPNVAHRAKSKRPASSSMTSLVRSPSLLPSSMKRPRADVPEKTHFPSLAVHLAPKVQALLATKRADATVSKGSVEGDTNGDDIGARAAPRRAPPVPPNSPVGVFDPISATSRHFWSLAAKVAKDMQNALDAPLPSQSSEVLASHDTIRLPRSEIYRTSTSSAAASTRIIPLPSPFPVSYSSGSAASRAPYRLPLLDIPAASTSIVHPTRSSVSSFMAGKELRSGVPRPSLPPSRPVLTPLRIPGASSSSIIPRSMDMAVSGSSGSIGVSSATSTGESEKSSGSGRTTSGPHTPNEETGLVVGSESASAVEITVVTNSIVRSAERTGSSDLREQEKAAVVVLFDDADIEAAWTLANLSRGERTTK